MNQDVTAAVDVLNSPIDVSTLTAGNSSPDALARLGDALTQFSTRVARRERELNRLFEQIAVERTSLLDAVLTRLFSGFTGVIPFDRVECAFLSDDAGSAVSYWARTIDSDPSSPGHVTSLDGGDLPTLLTSGRPRITSDMALFVSEHPTALVEQRLFADGARAVLTCPLVADGAPLGFLFFTSRRTHAFTESHAAAFQRAATQVSIVVQKTRAYGEVVNHNRMLIRETRRLREVATTDALTGVMNRRALDAALASAWERYEREHTGFGVIFCDVDHFKQVNDTHGHAVGDEVLATIARCLGRGLRGHDLIGRWGGEEFLGIVDTTSETTLANVAERLRHLIGRESVDGVSVTASFGSAVCRHYSTLGDLIVSADRALYSAKAAGRNRCVMAMENDGAVASSNAVVDGAAAARDSLSNGGR